MSSTSSPLPPAAVPVGSAHLTWLSAVSIAKSVGRIVMRGARRTRAKVASEYDQGAWLSQKQERRWERARDLLDYLVGAMPEAPRVAKVQGQFVRIPTKEYYLYRVRALQDVIAEAAGDSAELLELGSGIGTNLFTLALSPRWQRLDGLDLSRNGIDVARTVAERFGLAGRMHFDLLDLTNPKDRNYATVAGRTVFTWFCLEQIPRATDVVIETLLRFGPRRVIHVEPGLDFLDLRYPPDLANSVYLRSVDYQRQLLQVLEKHEQAGRLRIVTRRRLGFAPTLQHEGLLAVWEPTR